MSAVSIAGRAPWLGEAGTQHLLALLSADGEEARVAGGAVRNALIGEPVTDIDIATTALPRDVIRRVEAAGLRAVPTGIEHGTVTVIAEGRPFEVTTLRADVETDGRRARVVFGRDWKADAGRRDFTVNALYAGADGGVVDLVGGVDDIAARRIRFIGDAEARIREDYLRILRFFRFFAWYGDGRPDAEGLKACARLKQGLARLSAERVWKETRRLLEAPDPGRALLWMRQASVLTAVLPETEGWGIDAIPGLLSAEAVLGWQPDPLLRLAAMMRPDAAVVEALAGRLKLSGAERERLLAWAASPDINPATAETAFARLLYRNGPGGLRDRLRLAQAAARAKAETDPAAMRAAGGHARLLAFLERWQKPRFPVGGKDIRALGVAPGPRVGAILGTLEREWVDGDFKAGRDALMERAAALANG